MAEPALLRFAGRLRRGETDAALQHRLRDRGLVLRQQQADDDPPPPSQDPLIHRLPLLSATEIEIEINQWHPVPALAPCRARLRELTLHLDEVSHIPTLAPDLHRDLLIVLAAAPGDGRSRQRLIDKFFLTRGSSLVDFHLQLRQVQRHCPALWQLESSFLGFLPELAPLSFWQKLLHNTNFYRIRAMAALPFLLLGARLRQLTPGVLPVLAIILIGVLHSWPRNPPHVQPHFEPHIQPQFEHKNLPAPEPSPPADPKALDLMMRLAKSKDPTERNKLMEELRQHSSSSTSGFHR